MNKASNMLLGLSLAVCCTGVAAAQDMSSSMAIPKVLVIQREYTKPGKSGAAHEKTESAFVQAMSKAKWPTHYLAMTSLSGKSRALFFLNYPSFEAWEKDGAAMQKNAAFAAAMDHANMVDGELLDSSDQGVFVLQEEMSLHPKADLSGMRFMEISSYQVKPGHTKEWNETVKMVKAAYEKGIPGSHWGMFQQMYGGEGGNYLVLTSHKSLAEIDTGLMDSSKFAAALGEDGMKKLDELVASCVESSMHQIFAFSPNMSYVDDAWIKADPDYWKPKMSTAPMAKPAAEAKKTTP
jgi:hypothetical protein